MRKIERERVSEKGKKNQARIRVKKGKTEKPKSFN